MRVFMLTKPSQWKSNVIIDWLNETWRRIYALVNCVIIAYGLWLFGRYPITSTDEVFCKFDN